MARIPLLICVVALAGCGPSADDVSFFADGRVFAPGTEIPLVLENHSLEVVHYNFCTARLEAESGPGDWTAAPAACTSDVNCDLVAYQLRGWAEARGAALSIGADCPGGTYRYTLTLGLDGTRSDGTARSVEVSTPPFELARRLTQL